MFVWLPNFAMTRARLKQPPLARPQEPLVLVEKDGNMHRIAALDKAALEAGLYPGQPLADALAVLPTLIAADAEPNADSEALKALAAWAQRYSPATAAAEPHGLWLDITGCAHLWGGEEELAEDLLTRLENKGIPAKAAIADTFGAAFALAHHTGRYLSAPRGSHRRLLPPLPVERLRISSATASLLRKLGLFTIADIQSLPRPDLARRFPDLLPRLDEAMGYAEEAIDFLRPSTPWIERIGFADPISAPEDLERVTAKLLEMLCAKFEAKRRGAKAFEVSFFRADGGAQSASVSTALPTRDASRVLRLFREKLGFIDPGFGVDAVALMGSHVEPLEVRQTNLLRSVQHTVCVEDLAALIDTLENRLGKGRVHRIAPRESYIPERAVIKQSVIPKAQKRPLASFKDLGARPIRLFARPQPIDVTAAVPDAPPIFFRWRRVVHRVARAEGPERIAPEWWRTDDPSANEETYGRDYYRVENTQGLRFWIYREGTYGANRLPRWYLHGLLG
jgi:protein ImuB